ncbi:MAG: carboxypeptidase regulatory-like domain-containing protein [Sphingobacteriaceae bacterium]
MFHYALSSRRGILLVFFVCLIFSSFHTQDDLIDKIASSLSSWTGERPQEKVYLHMDKPYYALGDTIWFKAYVTVGSRHQLSGLSGALYVDLVNETDAIQETLKLPLTAGMSIGDFTLSDTLKEGNYRIRAYTRWMRNAGADYFFDRTFAVGNPGSEEVTGKVSYDYKTTAGKPVVTALLNYTDASGLPLVNKDLRYEIMANHEAVASEKAKTDASGNISITIQNDQTANLKGAYIQTTIETEKKKKVSKRFPIKAALSQSDVQFFPESGELVNGLASRVAFKAVGVDGTAVNIKGTITDNQDQEVSKLESTHAGMGTFNLKPEAGKTYKVKIMYPDGSETNLNLPKAVEEGYVLAVYQPEGDSLLVRINASAKAVNQTVNLLAQTGGEIIYATPIKITQIQTSVWLRKKNFPSGIAQFTLFDSQGQPVNERIAFIKNSDQMQLKISTGKPANKTREKVELELEAKDQNGKAVAGSFSVAVIDESKVPVDETAESTIFSNILLTSDLKGYIEKPNYYFTSETEQKNKALDNLMLTQGYRRFTWKDVLSGKPGEPVFKAEKLGTEISGKVLSLNGKPLPNGKVTLMSLKAGIVRDTITDAQGRFSFDKLVLYDSLKFSVQARTAKNGKQVEVVLDKVPAQILTPNNNIGDINTNIADTIKSYLANNKKEFEILERTGKLNRVQRLKEVVIKGKRPEDNYATQGMFRIPEGHSDLTYIIPNPELCANLGICLQGRLGQVVFQALIGEYCSVTNWPHTYEPGKGLVPMQVILDGRRITNCVEVSEIFDQNVIDPTDIVKIEVVRSSLALKAMLGGPSLMIYTKRGMVRKKYDPSITNVTPKGFNNARAFYSPRYDSPQAGIPLPDFRSTVYWNPNIITAADGKTKFDFFNADDPGNYKVIVEGINAAGELGRQVYRYKVE